MFRYCGLAGVCAAVVLAFAGQASAGDDAVRAANRLPGKAADNAVQAENRLAGTTAWLVAAGEPPAGAAEIYASEVSAAPGESFHLHVTTQPAARYRLLVYRLGWYGGAGGRLVACTPSCTDDRAGTSPPPHPAPDPVTGEVRAGWPVTDTVPVGADWTSGYFIVRVLLTSGPYAGRAGALFLVVREPPTRAAATLVQVPVNTWQAYNSWGGKSLYNFNSTGDVPATHVSFDRPYARTRGYQSPLAWEIQAVRFLEREGYDVAYTTDVETDADPGELLRHRLVVVVGHGEYWTKAMRDGFDLARDRGTNLAFLGANAAYWQVRYENVGRTVVGYKSKSTDPIRDPALKTTLFRDLTPPRYECQLLGVQHQGATRENVDPTIAYRPTSAATGDPWFAGTGLTATTPLDDLVGNEWDSIPTAVQAPECVRESLTVLFHHEGRPGNADAVRYVADSGARVFSSGSMQFAWGLDDFSTRAYGHPTGVDSRLQQFMRNALDDLGRPAPPVRLDAFRVRGGVSLQTAHRDDPRVQVEIVRFRGSNVFDPTLGRPVCSITTGGCVDRLAGNGLYRYAALTVDRWGWSVPVYSLPVLIRHRVA